MMGWNEKEVFREVTLRITGKPKLEDALLDLFEYLRQIIPLKEIGISRYELDANVWRPLLKVSTAGVEIIYPDYLTVITRAEREVIESFTVEATDADVGIPTRRPMGENHRHRLENAWLTLPQNVTACHGREVLSPGTNVNADSRTSKLV